jgi:hypothetical protein
MAGNYDGALLNSGMLAGAPRTYDFRLDLRAIMCTAVTTHADGHTPLWA